MSVASKECSWLESGDWKKHEKELEAASSLSQMVCIVLAMGLLLARKLLENELERRAQVRELWPPCPSCGKRLNSKGWEPRQVQTLVGVVY